MAGALLDGVLPWAYSQGNRLRNRLTELVSDPVGTVQQAAGQLGDSANAMHGLLTQAYADPKSFQPTDQNALAALVQGLQAGPLGFAPVGMTAWHGSPHVFDQFDSSKIGTGEGAQAYGHGLYLAEAPGVAQSYQKGLTERDFIRKVKDTYSEADDPASAALALARNRDLSQPQRQLLSALRKDDNLGFDYPHQAVQAVLRDRQNFDLSPRTQQALDNFGSLYKVDLPDPVVAKMLDWDKPLSQQPHVMDALTGPLAAFRPYADTMTGAQMVAQLGNNAQASAQLRAIGIPGIRYLDGGSRGTGQGSSNFVVFPGEEGSLQVLERNGQPLK